MNGEVRLREGGRWARSGRLATSAFVGLRCLVRTGACRVSLTAMLPANCPHSTSLSSVSDYVIDDKVAILQKRDHEGFGFVLRGAKGNGCGFWGYCVAGDVFCVLRMFLPPLFNYPLPLVVCLSLECLSTKSAGLFIAFRFLKTFLVKVNGGRIHRGVHTGLGNPHLLPTPPRLPCLSSQVPRAG